MLESEGTTIQFHGGGLVAFGRVRVSGPLPRAKQPEDVGFSSHRLERIKATFQSEINKGGLPGAVILIARRGRLAYLEAFGFQDREKQVAMTIDAIFRIASLTKPVISVAVMMLVEEGKIRLTAPVSSYLPEFKETKVGVEKINSVTGKPELVLEPARREMTIHDLLRHTSGLCGMFGNSLVDQAYREADVFTPRQTLAQFVSKLSKLPLAYHPGTTFEYSVSTDLLGHIIEVVSGMNLDEIIADRITKPLSMPDTGFYATGAQVARVAEPQIETETGKRPAMRDVVNRPTWLSGGVGMISTAIDYARFCQMLLNGGEFNGVRLLSPKTVVHMTANHLPPDIAMSLTVSSLFGPLIPDATHGQGFGLGFAVRTEAGRNPLPGSSGEYYWVGSTGTVFWVDPKESLIAVMMQQIPLMAFDQGSLIRNLVYQAMVD